MAMGTGKRRGDQVFAVVMIAPALLFLLALSVYPLTVAVRSSFFSIDTVSQAERYLGLGNFLAILRSGEFWHALQRSVIWTTSGVALQLVIAIAISLLLHAELKGRTLARGLVLFPYLVPAVVVALVWRFMFDPLVGVVNYVLVDVAGVISQPIAWLGDPRMAMLAVIIVGVWKYVPFMVILFLGRLQVTPLELAEAARIDGAGPVQVFRYVTWPWLIPIVMVALILRTIWMFNEFDIVYLLAFGGPVRATQTLPVLIRDTAFELQDIGRAAAVSLLMALILLPCVVGYLRLFQRGEERLST